MAERLVNHNINESTELNLVYIIVFCLGGTGEGKQHLGSDGKIPNKQVAIPEIQSGYDTPPNPCPVNAKVKGEYLNYVYEWTE